ncbi:MAG TPA: Gfo/Idh/MocA family oxidoreductase [Anaerolineaceae bacterium]|nr:Gfo/Idh/MocA family oxidoreductase [Anaerolineaceae bacterium]
MAHTFSVGIIGAGMYSRVHSSCFQLDGRAQVTWLASRSAQPVQEVAAEFGIAHSSTNYREMLKDPALDAVVITTPPDTHAQMTVDALRAGKHVLLEKPMTTTPAGMRRILAEAERHPELVVLECTCRHTRLQPKFRLVKQLIAEGKLGTVYHIHHNSAYPRTYIEYNPHGSWAMYKKSGGGGPFFDWGGYDLSFHLGVLGDAPRLERLRAFTRGDLRDMSRLAPGSDIEQHGAAFMEFDHGLTYYYERGSGVYNSIPSQTRIYGTLGCLTLSFPTWDSPEVIFSHAGPQRDGPARDEVLIADFSQHPPAEERYVPGHNDNRALVSHFLDCLQGIAQPVMPVQLAAKHLEIVFRITQ